MSALSPVLRSVAYGFGNGSQKVAFWCPGCEEEHAISVGAGGWAWDGNVEAPTFSPSVLVRGGHHVDGKRPCWCDYAREHPEDPYVPRCFVCHSFVSGGRIAFLPDCTHALAGQTVPLPPWPEDMP